MAHLSRWFALLLLVVCLGMPFAAGASAQQVSEAERVLEQFERALNAYDEDTIVGLAALDGTLRDLQGRSVTEQEVRSFTRGMRERRYHFHFSHYSTTDQEGRTRFLVEAGQGEWYLDGAAPERGVGIAEVRGGRIAMIELRRNDSEVSASSAPVAQQATPTLAPVPLAVAAGSLVALALGFARWRRRVRLRAQATLSSSGLHANLERWAAARRRPG